ncbi:MAG: hypothetical protein IPJ26_15905 [Bacteroidetes bacterium]|nr:hypothetical protein [Bacteroidota bacterium]
MEKSDYNEEGFNDYKRKIYQSELSAYKLISENTIRQFFPKHYTGITIERVCDNAGVDISDQFLLECALILDLIEGTSMKQNEIQVTECYKKAGLIWRIFFKN